MEEDQDLNQVVRYMKNNLSIPDYGNTVVYHPIHYGGKDNPLDLEELKKARQYLDREISKREEELEK